jgi:hypothetical protein
MCAKKSRWSSGVLANDVLIGGCAENRRRERDIVVHAHRVHRVQQTARGLQICCAMQKKGSNRCTSRSRNSRVKDRTESVKRKTYVCIWNRMKEYLMTSFPDFAKAAKR